MFKVIRCISGAQTGADTGGLMAAYDLFIETGGTMPKDFITENGPATKNFIDKYKLVEGSDRDYKTRTRKNVLDSDATLLFGDLSGGTKLTMSYCMFNKRPCCHIVSFREIPKAQRFLADIGNLRHPILANEGKERIIKQDGLILNIAGNRESKNEGIAQTVYDFVKELLEKFNRLTG
jgi:hypothetical protein